MLNGLTSPRSGTCRSIRDNTPARIHIACRYDRLHRIRDLVAHCCRRAAINPLKAAQFVMAVDEACSNVIEHSYGGDVPAECAASHPGILVTCTPEPHAVTVEIVDRGASFDPARAPVVSPRQYLREHRSRGLGLYIIRSFVDEFSYEPAGRLGNCLTLRVCDPAP